MYMTYYHTYTHTHKHTRTQTHSHIYICAFQEEDTQIPWLIFFRTVGFGAFLDAHITPYRSVPPFQDFVVGIHPKDPDLVVAAYSARDQKMGLMNQ